MRSFSNRDESFPTPPPYYSPDDKTGHQVKIYHIHSPLRCSPAPLTHLPCSVDIPPGEPCPTKSPLQGLCATPVLTPIPKFVSHESDLYRSPALTSCPSCRARVTTRVRYRVGTYSWIVCVVFVLCGLILGCCLLPFLLNHFKDAHHSCPQCHRLLHVHRRTCY
ncbi:lipopolysaccharide-induced tumor necrosis factor-alpha factor homolog [Corythoichthys intestinalis]|uniref:lipopolysaccharide-induced tumor necrosis factor-alpha factor homolog n=1 Tax=Corythoichthys intestinalis TaxID=161448 RepID=UPI0025A5440F|nr:lipopolysaccharide-induced tumor necrosis factor-alpha factor homolog [Corythoichthys intestinalis]